LNNWNTLRFAGYGACVGMLYAAYQDIGLWTQGPDMIARAIGGLIGGAVGGAVLGSLLSGIRNLFVRLVR
jgi:hypothetical protein